MILSKPEDEKEACTERASQHIPGFRMSQVQAQVPGITALEALHLCKPPGPARYGKCSVEPCSTLMLTEFSPSSDLSGPQHL